VAVISAVVISAVVISIEGTWAVVILALGILAPAQVAAHSEMEPMATESPVANWAAF
jgi:hypothetical protein